MRIKEVKYDLRGHEFILRSAEEQDAEMLLNGLKTVCGETRFLGRNTDEVNMTVEEEAAIVKKIKESENGVMLLGFLDGEYVGNCSLMTTGFSRQQHRTNLGIALFQKYTGLGLGRIMMEKLIEIAERTSLEQIELQVVADNESAVSLYKKMGFEICGTFPHGMKYEDGSYADEYFMVRKM